ncbi:hypothetical protein CBOM_02894 [Ceraceosorus bombacis]|uniref:Uncharacterized protein n=1 Tax=Ceraceosorus bombacis TaxID=401625 RepID=A0A0P1BGH0_9BASI|nr:hypothetical protein CBOM_02894 [Ceraceosorus bombacis]
MPPKKRPLTPLTDEELSEDDPVTKGKTTSERHSSMQQDTKEGQASVPSPAPSESEAKPATPKKKSRSTPGTPGRAASGWTEATQGLMLMLLASGNLSLSKDKKATISKMLGRSEKSVEMWWSE